MAFLEHVKVSGFSALEYLYAGAISIGMTFGQMQHLVYEVKSGRLRSAVASDSYKISNCNDVVSDTTIENVGRTLDGLVGNEFDKVKPAYSRILRNT